MPPPAPTDDEAAVVEDDAPAPVADEADAEPPADVSDEPPPAPEQTPDAEAVGGDIVVATNGGEEVGL